MPTSFLQFKDKQLNSAILNNLANTINKRLRANKSILNKRIKELIRQQIEESDVWKSLTTEDGQLYAELGVPKSGGISSLNNVLEKWISSIEILTQFVTVKPRSLKGRITIQGIQADYQDVLPTTQVESTSGPWNILEPLLNWGDTAILEWRFDRPNKYELRHFSRSGKGIMRKAVTRGGTWSCPSWSAGRPGSNFVTRAIENAMPKLMTIIKEVT